MPVPSSTNARHARGPEEPQAVGPRQPLHGSGDSAAGHHEASRPTGAGVNTGAGTTREKTEAEKEADRKYEEAMEEEYAKREGGA